jgi:hypothetical protein
VNDFYAVQSHEYPRVRERVRPHLEALSRASLKRWTAEILDRALAERDMQLWATPGFRTIAITSVEADTVTIRACSGDARDWKPLIGPFVAHIEEWARKLGKSHVVVNGRPGWSRFTKQRGYRCGHIEMIRSI